MAAGRMRGAAANADATPHPNPLPSSAAGSGSQSASGRLALSPNLIPQWVYFPFPCSTFLSSASVRVFTTSPFVSQPLRATPAPRRR